MTNREAAAIIARGSLARATATVVACATRARTPLYAAFVVTANIFELAVIGAAAVGLVAALYWLADALQ